MGLTQKNVKGQSPVPYRKGLYSHQIKSVTVLKNQTGWSAVLTWVERLPPSKGVPLGKRVDLTKWVQLKRWIWSLHLWSPSIFWGFLIDFSTKKKKNKVTLWNLPPSEGCRHFHLLRNWSLQSFEAPIFILCDEETLLYLFLLCKRESSFIFYFIFLMNKSVLHLLWVILKFKKENCKCIAVFFLNLSIANKEVGLVYK